MQTIANKLLVLGAGSGPALHRIEHAWDLLSPETQQAELAAWLEAAAIAAQHDNIIYEIIDDSIFLLRPA